MRAAQHKTRSSCASCTHRAGSRAAAATLLCCMSSLTSLRLRRSPSAPHLLPLLLPRRVGVVLVLFHNGDVRLHNVGGAVGGECKDGVLVAAGRGGAAAGGSSRAACGHTEQEGRPAANRTGGNKERHAATPYVVRPLATHRRCCCWRAAHYACSPFPLPLGHSPVVEVVEEDAAHAARLTTVGAAQREAAPSRFMRRACQRQGMLPSAAGRSGIGCTHIWK